MNYKKLLLISLCAFSFLSHGKRVVGEAKFFSKEGDDLSFIKKQLRSNAFKKIVDIELKAMNLDHETFWTNYNGKFEESFKEIEAKLRSRYQKDEEQEIPKKYLEKYQTQLRVKRLKSKATFGRLGRVIKKFSVEKLSKSVVVSNSHFIRLNALVDRSKLTEIYYSFIGVSTYRSFTTAYIKTHFKLINTNWVELGVNTESDFTDVVSSSWQKKMGEMLGDTFSGGVVIADNTILSEIEEYRSQMKANKETGLVNSETPFAKFYDSLLVNIAIEIKKIDFDENLKNYTYHFKGGAYVTDLKNSKIVKHFDFPPTESEFTRVDDHSFSSSLASYVYRMAIPVVGNFRKVVEENVKTKKNFELVVDNVENLNDIYKFSKVLKDKGVIFFFDPEIEEITDKKVRLKVNYTGVKEKAIAILDQFKMFILDKNVKISRQNDLPFSFIINRLQLDEGQDGESEDVEKVEESG